MEGTIIEIKIYPEKGSSGLELTEGHLMENMGLEGDCHAKGGERQISLLFTGGRESIADSGLITEKGLCHDRFKENITIRSQALFSAGRIDPGTRFAIGETVLEISGETKHCHGECELFTAGKSCPLAGQNLFARVEKGGVIRIGEEIVRFNPDVFS